jgi:hypothetical protein
MIEALIDRIASSDIDEKLMKLAAIQLLVGSHLDFGVPLELLDYHGITVFRAERKFLVVPGSFCSCVAARTGDATCKHLIAVAARMLLPPPLAAKEDSEKFVSDILKVFARFFLL